VPATNKNGWWKVRAKKGNHIRLILGIKGTMPMNMGRTHNNQEKRDNKNRKSLVTKEIRNSELKVKKERKRERK